MTSIKEIKQLREETGVSISECKRALEKAGGDIEKAKDILKKLGREFAEKKKDREAGQGIVVSYIHPNKKIGVLLELCCETDFVSKSPDFQNLAHELCLQIAALCPETSLGDEAKASSLPFAVARFFEQNWIKDESKTIKDLIGEYIAKTGENIVVKRFIRYQI